MRDFESKVGCKLSFGFVFELDFDPESEKIGPALFGMSQTTLGEVPGSVSRFSRVPVATLSAYIYS